VTMTAPSPLGRTVSPQGSDTGREHTGETFEHRIGEIRHRAGHPQGYRLYDYRPDLLVLTSCVEAVLRIHQPQGGAAAGAHAGGRCRVCLHAWPCPTVAAVNTSLGVAAP
jgi:hypothetical protein